MPGTELDLRGTWANRDFKDHDMHRKNKVYQHKQIMHNCMPNVERNPDSCPWQMLNQQIQRNPMRPSLQRKSETNTLQIPNWHNDDYHKGTQQNQIICNSNKP